MWKSGRQIQSPVCAQGPAATRPGSGCALAGLGAMYALPVAGAGKRRPVPTEWKAQVHQ